jgi:hypothetical protein
MNSKNEKTNRIIYFMKAFDDAVKFLTNTQREANHSHVILPLFYQRSKVYYQAMINNSNSNNKELSHSSKGSSCCSTSSIDTNLYLFQEPIESDHQYLAHLNNYDYLNSNHVIDKNSIQYLVSNNCSLVNNLGKWIQIIKIKVNKKNNKTAFIYFRFLLTNLYIIERK